jgi:leucyl aminopeptidase
MEIGARGGRLPEAEADTIVVNLLQGVTQPSGATGALDEALGGAISRLIEARDFTGKLNQTAVLYPPAGGALNATRVLLVGLGKREEFTPDRARQAAGAAARRARELGAKEVASVLHGAGAGGLAPREAAQALAEGSLLGLYRFDQLKGTASSTGGSDAGDEGDEKGDGSAGRTIQRITVVELDEARLPEIEEGLRRGRILAESTSFARDLVTRPGNDLTPRTLANRFGR